MFCDTTPALVTQQKDKPLQNNPQRDLWSRRQIVLTNPHQLCYSNNVLHQILHSTGPQILPEIRAHLQSQQGPSPVTAIPDFELSLSPWPLVHQQCGAVDFSTHLVTCFEVPICRWSLEVRHPEFFFSADQGGPVITPKELVDDSLEQMIQLEVGSPPPAAS